MEKQTSHLEHRQPMEQTRGSLSITTPVSILANEFEDRSVLLVQMSLAAVNQICVIRDAMNESNMHKTAIEYNQKKPRSHELLMAIPERDFSEPRPIKICFKMKYFSEA